METHSSFTLIQKKRKRKRNNKSYRRVRGTVDGGDLWDHLQPLHHFRPGAARVGVEAFAPELGLVLDNIPHQRGQAGETLRIRGLVRINGSYGGLTEDDGVEVGELGGGEGGAVDDRRDGLEDTGVARIGLGRHKGGRKGDEGDGGPGGERGDAHCG